MCGVIADKPIQAGSQRARAARQSVFLIATLERFGSSEVTTHRVRDLSVTGMRIDKAAAMPVGATVLVAVGRLEAVGATIVWVQGNTAGVKFAVNIDPDQARGKAAIAPNAAGAIPRPKTAVVPTAGWIEDLSSPYRKVRHGA